MHAVMESNAELARMYVPQLMHGPWHAPRYLNPALLTAREPDAVITIHPHQTVVSIIPASLYNVLTNVR